MPIGIQQEQLNTQRRAQAAGGDPEEAKVEGAVHEDSEGAGRSSEEEVQERAEEEAVRAERRSLQHKRDILAKGVAPREEAEVRCCVWYP